MRARKPISHLLLLLILGLTPITSHAQNTVSHQAADSLSEARNPGIETIGSDDFNAGFNLYAEELLLGRVSGLFISRPGNDPQGFIDTGIRSLSSILSGTKPLFIVDGVPVNEIEHLDPQDIESFRIIKSTAAAAAYGLRGAPGVVEIQTLGSTVQGSEPRVLYRGSVSSSFLANQVQFLSPREFRRYSASIDQVIAADYGSATNWQDRVLQHGISHRHHLSITGGNETTRYAVSGGYRYIDTIQQGANQDRTGARLYLSHSALNQRLVLTARLAATKQISNPGFSEIFRYANTFNPTAPVFDDEGKYFENFFFDSFNPLSIQNQAVRDSEFSDSRLQLGAMFDAGYWVPGSSIEATVSSGNRNHLLGEYYGKHLKFRGLNRNGLASYLTENHSDLFASVKLKSEGKVGSTLITFEAGTGYQKFTNGGQFATGGNFLSDSFTYNSLQSASDFQNGNGIVDSFEAVHEISGFDGSISLSNSSFFDAGGHLRYESSSRLGSNNKWGTFFGLWAGTDLNRFLNISGIDESYLHLSYGVAGQIPPFNGMASLSFREGNEFYFQDRFSPSLFVPVSPNPDLKWEEKREFETGIRISLFEESLSASITYFNNRTDDLILLLRVPSPPNLANRQWKNAASLSGSGFEATMEYRESWGNVQWRSRLTVTRAVSVYEELPQPGFESFNGLLAFPGAPGLGNTQLNQIRENEKVGNFWGPEFAGFDSSGQWLFRTSEGGIVSAFEITPDDYIVIGNGLPDFTVGWDHRFSLFNWDLTMFWLGEFGHDMINLNRLYYENPNYLAFGNVLESTPGTRLRAAPFFSDYYVEDASYLRLHSLTLGYRIESPYSGISHLRIYVTGNNLITLTGFDGIDPAARLSSNPPTDNGGMISDNRNYTAPGIERRNSWPTQTTFTAGIELAF